MKRLLLAACFCVSWAVTCWAQTALRPDQISPATPNVTWAPGGAGYQIGSTIAWRTDNTATPSFATDAARTVELTYSAGAITATLPDATASNFGDGFGFAIQTTGQLLTLFAVTTPTVQKINGLASIKVGAYQLVSLSSRGGNWYATYSLPQPPAQTAATVLADNMTWVTAGGPVTPVISGVNLPTTTFTAGTAGTVGTATANMSAGSFTGGTWDLKTSGTDNTSTTCIDYTGKFAITSGGVLTNTTTAVAGGNPGACVRATLAGATGSPFTQAFNLTGSSGGGAPTGVCPSPPGDNGVAATNYFSRVWAAGATLDGTVGGTPGPANHLAALNTLICALITDGVWAKLDGLWMPAISTVGHTNEQAVANLNLVALSTCTTNCYTLVPTGSPAFVADRGYTGVEPNTTMWIDTGFNPALASSPHFVSGEAHVSVWAMNNAQSAGFGKALGAANSTFSQSTYLVPRGSDGKQSCGVTFDVSSTATVATVGDSLGSSLCEVTGGNSYLMKNGASLVNGTNGEARPPTTVYNGNVYLLNWNQATKNGGPWQIGQASIGASLSFAQISSTGSAGGAGTTASGLVPRVCQYLRAIGAVASC